MYQNTFITKITEWITKWSCWILDTFRLALGGLLAIRVYVHRLRRPTTVVDATPGSLATPDASVLRLSCNFLIRSADVVLGLSDSLDSALFARGLSRCFWRILLLYLGFIARFVVLFLSIFIFCCLQLLNYKLLFICAQATLLSSASSTRTYNNHTPVSFR
jgi:hypothetical protein